MHRPSPLQMSLTLAASALLASQLLSSTLPVQDDAEKPDPALACARVSNQFGLGLFQQIRDAKGNLFYSPYSVAVALAMTRVGADGETAKQMDDVLAANGSLLPALHAALSKALEPGKVAEGWGEDRKQVPTFALDVANRVWLQQSLEVGYGFALVQRSSFAAPIGRIDFRKTDAARKAINDWVAKQTRDKIQDIVPASLPTPDTLIALANAIYFKAAWAESFYERATKEQAFHRQDGSKIDVPMMNRTDLYAYGENKSAQLLAIPYKGNECEMLILLPKEGSQLEAFEKQLDAKTLEAWIAQMKSRRAMLTLPKFEMTSKFELSGALQKMGMQDAFDAAKADFSKITKKLPIVMGPVLHKAFIAIDEEGTEAAAATVVMGKLGAAMPREEPVAFVADRPFVFAIRHRKTGALLFLGRVADPSKS